jgi:hypothetical protein
MLCATEKREMMEEIVCTYQLKSLREQAASGQYIRPQILQFSPTELASCVELSSEQKSTLEAHWKQFVIDINMARATLCQYTSQVADDVEAAMAMGEYRPNSGVDAAEVSY